MDYRTNASAPPPDRSILVVGLAGKVLGLDRDTGAIAWISPLPELTRDEVFIAVGYGVVVASADTDSIVCLDYLTGELRWAQRTHSAGRATILIEPEQIVCAKAGYVDCYTPDGQRRWRQPLTGHGVGRVALGYPGNVAQADERG